MLKVLVACCCCYSCLWAKCNIYLLTAAAAAEGNTVWLCIIGNTVCVFAMGNIVWLCIMGNIVWVCAMGNIAWLFIMENTVLVCAMGNTVWLCIMGNTVWGGCVLWVLKDQLFLSVYPSMCGLQPTLYHLCSGHTIVGRV